jgi:hypothetical protein
MPRFTEAFNLWLSSHPESSQRKLAADAGIPSSTLSQVSNGAGITNAALAKLLPTIIYHSSRGEALTLLVAYLEDETPPAYISDIRIYAVDQNNGTVRKDRLARMAEFWLEKARSDADFANMWLLQDAYMSGDTASLEEQMPRPAPQAPSLTPQARSPHFAAFATSILQEEPAKPFSSDELALLAQAAAQRAAGSPVDSADSATAHRTREPAPTPAKPALPPPTSKPARRS